MTINEHAEITIKNNREKNKRNVKHIYTHALAHVSLLSVRSVTFSLSPSQLHHIRKITANNLNNWLYVIARTKPFYIQL